jgi:hypothetical protein
MTPAPAAAAVDKKRRRVSLRENRIVMGILLRGRECDNAPQAGQDLEKFHDGEITAMSVIG